MGRWSHLPARWLIPLQNQMRYILRHIARRGTAGSKYWPGSAGADSSANLHTQQFYRVCAQTAVRIPVRRPSRTMRFLYAVSTSTGGPRERPGATVTSRPRLVGGGKRQAEGEQGRGDICRPNRSTKKRHPAGATGRSQVEGAFSPL